MFRILDLEPELIQGVIIEAIKGILGVQIIIQTIAHKGLHNLGLGLYRVSIGMIGMEESGNCHGFKDITSIMEN